ncbi:MAG: peptidoglycan-binding protein [Cyanobacteria bacterium J06626_6]
MIRHSTLVFLTCLAALSVSTVPSKAQVAAERGGATRVTRLEGATIARPEAATPVSEARSSVIAQLNEGATPESASSNVLSIGSRGQAVSALQNRLKNAEYYSGAIDGIYGLATQRAVRAFQESQSLDVTGRLDNETWKALESVELPAGDAVENAPETATAPPATDGESASRENADGADTSVVAVADRANGAAETAGSASGGLGKLFGLGLGLMAIAASFGVGFFIANRSKEEAALPDGDGWSGVEPDPGLTGANPALPPNPALSSLAGNVPSQNGNGSGGVSGLATTTAATASGQLGSTSPMGQTDIIDGLIQDLHNPDPSKRRKVIWELGQRGNSLAVKPLVDSMVNADSKEKSLVLAALSEIGIRSLKPMNRALAIALQDDNPEVRKNAIRDLTRIYELVVQISQMLGHATEDEDPEVRQTATWALDQLNRIRRTQDVDSTMRAFPTSGSGAKPIDLLSSEASIRRSQS